MTKNPFAFRNQIKIFLAVMVILTFYFFLGPVTPRVAPAYLIARDSISQKKIFAVTDERSIPTLIDFYSGTISNPSTTAQDYFVIDTAAVAHGDSVRFVGFKTTDSTIVTVRLYSKIFKRYSDEAYTLSVLLEH